jgi:pimeloyl-ACP methyl ester carboxylesterase
MSMPEHVIRSAGVELATEAFGDRQCPAVLLIMGAMASMLWWPAEFCGRLAGHGRYVIRYDQRDTGHSTKYPPGQARYTTEEMVDDAVRVLDGHSIAAAHFVGMSLGAMVGQIAAITYPTRVASLTAISSSPVGVDRSHLPGCSARFTEHLAAAESVDWSNRTQVIDYMIADAHVLAGTGRPLEDAQVRAFVERDYDRAGGYEHALNHAALEIADAWRGRLKEIKAPLLVIHGTADPVYPFEHGVALSQAVEGAKLVGLHEGGHELHPADWDTIVEAIITHTNAV